MSWESVPLALTLSVLLPCGVCVCVCVCVCAMSYIDVCYFQYLFPCYIYSSLINNDTDCISIMVRICNIVMVSPIGLGLSML